MDQALYTAAIADTLPEAAGIHFKVLIAKKEANHWFNVATLSPSGEQYFIESSFAGSKVFPINMAKYQPRFAFQNIIDQFGNTPSSPIRLGCSKEMEIILNRLFKD